MGVVLAPGVHVCVCVRACSEELVCVYTSCARVVLVCVIDTTKCGRVFHVRALQQQQQFSLSLSA